MAIARHNLRLAGIALLSAFTGSPTLAEVKLPVPAVDQSAGATRAWLMSARP